MNPETIRQQLVLAERIIRKGEYRIARLHERISLSHLSSFNPADLVTQLDQEERQQEMRRMDRGRLIAMLAWYEGSATETPKAG